jgi:membrane-bound ClpP family serine protease
MAWTPIVALVIAGLLLVAMDFYVPGFVLATIGAALMIAALVVSYHAYGGAVTVALFAAEVVLGFVVSYIAIKYVPQTALGKKMILAQTQTGVRSQTERAPELVGREGVAHTVLRPTGVALVDGKRLDVVAESGMIERGSQIKVVAVEDNRVVVRKI